MEVLIGNTSAKHSIGRDEDDNNIWESLPGNRVTFVSIPDDYSLREALDVVTAGNGCWAASHSEIDPTTGKPFPPAWVESSSPGLAQLLAENYGCPIGRPDGWVTEGEGPGADLPPIVNDPSEG